MKNLYTFKNGPVFLAHPVDTVNHKKRDILLLSITLANLNRLEIVGGHTLTLSLAVTHFEYRHNWYTTKN